MSKSSPPPSKALSRHAPLIHVMKVIIFFMKYIHYECYLVTILSNMFLLQLIFKVKPNKVNLIIGSGGKTIKSIIEETGVDAIDTGDDGMVRRT